MALTIYRSNRVETLHARLVERLVDAPLADPLAVETVVVPTYAMGRWLNLNLARRQGVAANIRYPQASEWLWSLAAAVLADLPPRDPCSSDALAWSCFDALPELLGHPAFAALRHYLDDDASGVKRWQLGQRVAACFDRYQSYRPEMIQAWSNGAESDWQALLWRHLVSERELPHRVDTMQALRRRLADPAARGDLPERVSLFALSRLAPTWFEIVHALAERSEVLLFQHNPTDQYWADLVNQKQLARKRLRNPRQGEYFDSGNTLLTSWGRQGQAMQDMLLDLAAVTVAEVEDNHEPASASLLHALQGSLFRLEQPTIELAHGDDSVWVQLCHSPLRECQVLHDRLLTLLARHPELNSEDILVMVPDISRYAPYIEAVFQPDSSHRRPSLGWNISDISVSNGHPLVRVFLQLLNLPGCRFTRSEILSFLECAEVRARFAIDAAMLDDIYRLVDAARVRWGIDADQRGELGLPAHAENTWQQAWERLFAGYAMVDDSPWQDIAPIDQIDGDSGIALGRFRHLFQRLAWWRQRLATAASGSAWQIRLHQLIDEFLDTANPDDDRLQPLRDAVAELGQTESRALEPELVRYWMEQNLATSRQSGRLYSGGVTFCGMQPMRNIPFAVICVLGMQDGDFPRRERPAEFDRMHDDWRAGDPQRGDEDRYLMLETLLCARRYLYFSYCAHNLRDNGECQPSVLLRELLDYIDEHVIDNGAGAASARISRLHPMQPFSARNFAGDEPGFDAHWFETARALMRARKRPAAGPWLRDSLPAAASALDTVDLDSLVRFFQHPLRYFYRHRLGIGLPRQEPLDDEEAFELSGLQQWLVVDEIARQHLAGETLQRRHYSARGMLPHGRAADAEWFRLMVDYRGLLEQLAPYSGLVPRARPVDCMLDDDLRLAGEVRDCYPELGLMHFSASRRARGGPLISLWLQHLALCASGGLGASERSLLLAPPGGGWRYHAVSADEARALLADYLRIYHQGQEHPLPVFPQTSYAWISQDDPDKAEAAASRAWNGDRYHDIPGERDDDFVRLALHNNPQNPLDDELFRRYARQVFAPMISGGGPLD